MRDDGVGRDGTARERVVARTAGQWRHGLVDVSGRNRRLFYRPLAVATLDLAHAEPTALRRLLSGQSVRIGALFPDDGTPDGAGTRLRARRAADAIWRKAVETQEETGANPARLAVGAASFASPDAAGTARGRPYRAPLILLPVRFTPAPGTRSVASVTLDGDAEVNSALRYVLAGQYGAELDEDALLAGADPDGPGGVVVDPELLAEAAAKALGGDVPGWQVLPHLTVDYFGSDRELMLRDLTDTAVLARHPVVAAMAGDADAQARVAGDALPPPEADRAMAAPDFADPAGEFLVLDADASQQRVIDLALAGRNLVVQGPPGTGKSQTIANLIAVFAAHGRSVLFVAQKRAAIEAVTARLERRGLGHLVLEVFDASVRRSHVLAQLAESLDGMVTAPPVDATELHRRLAEVRDRLVGYRAGLHGPREELGGGTVAELYQRLYAVDPEAQTQDRLTVSAVSRWGLDGVERRAADLADLVRLGALDPQWQDAKGWDPARVVTDEIAVAGHDAAVGAASYLAAARQASATAAREAGLAEPATPRELDVLAALLARADAVSAAVDPALLDARTVDDARLRLLAHAVADRELRRRDRADGIGAGWWRRRGLRREARELTGTTDDRSASPLLRELIDLRPAFEGVVVAAPSSAELAAVRERFAAALDRVTALVRGVDLPALPWDELAAALRMLIGDPRRARMPRAHALATGLDDAGATPVVASVAGRLRAGLVVGPEEAASRLRWAALSTLLDHLTASDPALAWATAPGALDRASADFRALDRSAIEVNASRVRRAAGEAALRRLTEHGDQRRYLQGELKKKRRLRSLRELVERAPEAVLAAAPCWAMSPLLVSRYLPAAPLFDVVVYDEASQVTVPDAVPSILRGRQVVVAGDDRQLPPTSACTKLLDDADDADAADADDDAALDAGPVTTPAPVAGTDHASVLTALAGILPTRTLLWHYRSRDERLIAVSNASVYGGRLVTFPGPRSDRVLRHVAVAPSPGLGTHNKSPDAEVARVVELCLEHAEQQRAVPPGRRESLGVIAAGIEHATRVEKALIGRGRGRGCVPRRLLRARRATSPCSQEHRAGAGRRARPRDPHRRLRPLRGRPAALPLGAAAGGVRRQPAQRRHLAGAQPHDGRHLVLARAAPRRGQRQPGVPVAAPVRPVRRRPPRPRDAGRDAGRRRCRRGRPRPGPARRVRTAHPCRAAGRPPPRGRRVPARPRRPRSRGPGPARPRPRDRRSRVRLGVDGPRARPAAPPAPRVARVAVPPALVARALAGPRRRAGGRPRGPGRRAGAARPGPSRGGGRGAAAGDAGRRRVRHAPGAGLGDPADAHRQLQRPAARRARALAAGRR